LVRARRIIGGGTSARPGLVRTVDERTDATITLGFYAKVMLRCDGEAERLKALVGDEFRQDIGRESEVRAPEPVIATTQTPVESGISGP
jgi:hypothetical protein